MVKGFEKATGKKVPYKIAPRRPGDIAVCYADPSKAEKELGWTAKKDIDDMCKDSWNYIVKNSQSSNSETKYMRGVYKSSSFYIIF